MIQSTKESSLIKTSNASIAKRSKFCLANKLTRIRNKAISDFNWILVCIFSTDAELCNQWIIYILLTKVSTQDKVILYSNTIQ